jgi:hypothetical protein
MRTGRGSHDELYERVVAAVLRQVVLRFAAARGLSGPRSGLFSARLFTDPRFALDAPRGVDGERAVHERLAEAELAGAALTVPYAELPPEIIGELYESFLSHALVPGPSGWRLQQGRQRRQTGSFFTPPELTQQVVARALVVWKERPAGGARPLSALRACDPALGGGAFLLELCRQVAAAASPGATTDATVLAQVVGECISGADKNPLAVATAECCLWLLAATPALDAARIGRNLHVADALSFPWAEAAAATGSGAEGFDLVIGNPPWVAYAGRAAQPLEPSRRAHYQRHFRAFKGYPTLHGLFIECAARIAPEGVIALVIPSPVADLDGYAATRLALTARHVVCEPLIEFGQDAFEGVTQPCFALVADASTDALASARPWLLSERQRARLQAEQLNAPRCLEQLAELPPLPGELFGEMGFQSSRLVSEQLLSRTAAAHGAFQFPLLEGRDVREFWQGAPRLFLNPDPQLLQEARCRLRAARDYQRVAFVVRQTARVTIAALHGGAPFRNSLLAGFRHPEYSPETVVALLNSALYRAFHLARQRDARQAAFPQVKIRHLRALPAPPKNATVLARLHSLTEIATRTSLTPSLRSELDEQVFGLFDVCPSDRQELLNFLDRLCPASQRRVARTRETPLSE